MEWTACDFRDMLSKLQHTTLRELSTYPGIVSTLFSPSVMSITPSSQPKAQHRQDLSLWMADCSFRTLDDSANSNRSLEVAAVPGTVESATCQTELEAGSR